MSNSHRQIFSAVLPLIRRDLGLTDTRLGLIQFYYWGSRVVFANDRERSD